MTTRNATVGTPRVHRSPATRPAPLRLAAALLALLVVVAGLNLPLLEHGHGLDEAHHHTCSACRLADACAGAEAPEFADLGVPDPAPIAEPVAPAATWSSRVAPDPLRPRAPPAA